MFHQQPDGRHDVQQGGGTDPEGRPSRAAPRSPASGLKSEVIAAIISTMGVVVVAIIGRGDPELAPHIYCPGAEQAVEQAVEDKESESAREAEPAPEVERPVSGKEPHGVRSVRRDEQAGHLPNEQSCEEASRQQLEREAIPPQPRLILDEHEPSVPMEPPSCEPLDYVPLPAVEPYEPDAGATGMLIDFDGNGDLDLFAPTVEFRAALLDDGFPLEFAVAMASAHFAIRPIHIDPFDPDPSARYEYDTVGRLNADTNAPVTFTYDADGDVVSTVDGRLSETLLRIDDELPRPPRERVLSLGIDYEWSLTVPTLTMAASDALEVASTFSEQGYQSDSLLDEQATLGGLLRRLYEEVGSSEPGDSFVLYFAGHGVSSPEGQRSVILPDDDGRLTIVPLDVLTALLRMHRGHVSVILDGCATTIPNLPTQAILPRDEGRWSGRVIYFAATSVGEDAVEAPDLQGGLFTKVLVREMERRWEHDQKPFRLDQDRATLTDVAATTTQLAFERYGVRQTPTGTALPIEFGSLLDTWDQASYLDVLTNPQALQRRSPSWRPTLVLLEPYPERFASAR
jgi:hypothetical protein